MSSSRLVHLKCQSGSRPIVTGASLGGTPNPICSKEIIKATNSLCIPNTEYCSVYLPKLNITISESKPLCSSSILAQGIKFIYQCAKEYNVLVNTDTALFTEQSQNIIECNQSLSNCLFLMSRKDKTESVFVLYDSKTASPKTDLTIILVPSSEIGLMIKPVYCVENVTLSSGEFVCGTGVRETILIDNTEYLNIPISGPSLIEIKGRLIIYNILLHL